MFPAPLRVVGCLDPGTELADPANDPQLLAETREHYWVQFNTGGGFQDADPTFAGAQIGQTFTAVQGAFTEMPDNLRHKVTIRLQRELTIPATGLFAGGSSQDVATVLDETFNTVELVGKPLSIGHFVNTNSMSAVFTSTTHTYSPYVRINREDANIGGDLLIRGTDYQEVLTNFPFGSQILTGLFLAVVLLFPDGKTETVKKTLFDRIGFAARQNGGSSGLNIGADTGPAINGFNTVTLLISSSRQAESALTARQQSLATLGEELNSLLPLLNQTDPVARADALQRISALSEGTAGRVASFLGEAFLVNSDRFAENFSTFTMTRIYSDSPRIVAVSSEPVLNQATQAVTARFELDILCGARRSQGSPLQAQIVQPAVRFALGVEDKGIEDLLSQLPPFTGAQPSSSYRTFLAALESGAKLVVVDSSNFAEVLALPLSDEAKARITQSVQTERVILVPDTMVDVEGKLTIAWLESDPDSGETTLVSEDGGHQTIFEDIARQYIAAFKGSYVAAEIIAAEYASLLVVETTALASLEAAYTAQPLKVVLAKWTLEVTKQISALALPSAGLKAVLLLNYEVMMAAAIVAAAALGDPPVALSSIRPLLPPSSATLVLRRASSPTLLQSQYSQYRSAELRFQPYSKLESRTIRLAPTPSL